MPTGYTHKIREGINFKEFALDCARAFGACVTLRDAPNDIEIPIFKCSDYHADNLKVAEARVKELHLMTLEDAFVHARREYEKELISNKKRLEEMQDLRMKYDQMLDDAKNWNPPTNDHKELKLFMIKQIEQSIEYDCDVSYYANQKIELLSGAEWLAKEREKAVKNIQYYTEEQKKEEDRVVQRNEWVRLLRQSL